MKKIFFTWLLVIPVLFGMNQAHANVRPESSPDTTDCIAMMYSFPNSIDQMTIHFVDISQPAGEVVSWLWEFGDGATSDEQNPSHTYLDAGTYNVFLTITTASGCTSTNDFQVEAGGGCNCPQDYDPVCVQTPNGIVQYDNECFAICEGYTPNNFVDCDLDTTNCYANFTFEIDPYDSLTIHFFDNSYGGGSDVIAWSWDFGDGNTSDDQNPSHTYAEAGTYNVILTITTADGCSSINDFPIEAGGECNCPQDYVPVCVQTPAGIIIQFDNACLAFCAGYTQNNFVDCDQDSTNCSAFFEYEIDADDSLTVHFFDISDGGGSEVIAWSWDFGDGGTSDDQNPSHTYAEAGTYNVILTITTANGCTSANDFQIEVGGDCNCPAVYDPVCVETSAGIIQFDNECLAICEGFNPNDFVDCDQPYCEALFFYQISTDNPLAVNFYDLTASSAGDVISWAWDFGDGATSNDQFPSHTYASTGVYLVKLTIQTADGCSSDVTLEVWLDNPIDTCDCPSVFDPVCVQTQNGIIQFDNACLAFCEGFTPNNFVDCDTTGPDCQALFGFEDADPSGLVINFYDASFATSDIVAWEWNFGDGASSTEQNPVHEYAQPGIYEVSLLIQTQNGCASDVAYEIFVGDVDIPECIAFFWPVPDSTQDLTYTFYDFAFGNVTDYSWDFGDGSTATGQMPTHTYAQPGTYDVTLFVEGTNCQNSFTLALNTDDFLINPNDPASNAVALYTPTVDLATNSVYFKNLSSSNAPLTEVKYSFGDGKTSDAYNVMHVFPAKKKYNVTLHVKNALGAESNFTGVIDMNTGKFKASTSNSSVILNNRSVIQQSLEASVSPNPAGKQVQISYELPIGGKTELSIRTVTGKTVFTYTANDAKGVHTVPVDVSDFPQGVYFVNIRSNNQTVTMKLVRE